jgi:uncharacterized protein (TIGR02444 family)
MLSEAAFWQYTCDFYSRPGITNACLTLQDQLGLNVNLLLLLCWCEQNNKQLSGQQLDLLIHAVAKWHREYTQPLRELRRKLALDDKASVKAKQSIFDVEMELEKTEQRLLLGAYNLFDHEASVQAQNIQRYVAQADKSAALHYASHIALLRDAF